MKVKLLKRQKEGEAGEIVEVSPDRADFFFSVEVAEPSTKVNGGLVIFEIKQAAHNFVTVICGMYEIFKLS